MTRPSHPPPTHGRRCAAAASGCAPSCPPTVHIPRSEVVVFGLDNIEVGHDIVAVYTSITSEPLNEFEFKRFLKMSLASHMVPKYLVHKKTFPSTGNEGKIDRLAVQEVALKELGVKTQGTDL